MSQSANTLLMIPKIHLILFNIHPDILHLLYGLCYSSQSVNTSCRDFINVLFQRVNTSCREIIKETKNSLDFILILILTIYQGQMSIFRRLWAFHAYLWLKVFPNQKWVKHSGKHGYHTWVRFIKTLCDVIITT